jgi:hypothetical protein
MGAIWLGTLPEVINAGGVEVDTYPGWETRSRLTGGYEAILAIQEHHTGSSGLNPLSEMRYMWEGAVDKPIGAIYLSTAGKATVGAAGATNTSGKGGPLLTSQGTIPRDKANMYVISIEAANRGDGTPWPDVQIEAYVKLVAALNRAYMGGLLLVPGDVHGHFEWTDRKIDPAGQSRYASGANKWNMIRFRSDVLDILSPIGPPTPPPTTIKGKELNMIIDLNYGTPYWVSMLLDGDELTHLVNGHHVAVMVRGGTARVPLGSPDASGETELLGILQSVGTTNDSPFGFGRPSHNAALDAAWTAARSKHI